MEKRAGFFEGSWTPARPPLRRSPAATSLPEIAAAAPRGRWVRARPTLQRCVPHPRSSPPQRRANRYPARERHGLGARSRSSRAAKAVNRQVPRNGEEPRFEAAAAIVLMRALEAEARFPAPDLRPVRGAKSKPDSEAAGSDTAPPAADEVHISTPQRARNDFGFGFHGIRKCHSESCHTTCIRTRLPELRMPRAGNDGFGRVFFRTDAIGDADAAIGVSGKMQSRGRGDQRLISATRCAWPTPYCAMARGQRKTRWNRGSAREGR